MDENVTGLFAAALGGLTALASVLLAFFAARRADLANRQRQARFVNAIVAAQTAGGTLTSGSGPGAKVTPPTSTGNSLSDVEKRVTAIEKRLPEDSEIDKYATVNDALLDSGLSHLRARVLALESQLMSKWDIAVVVFLILGALGVLTTVVFGVAVFLQDGVETSVPTPTSTATPTATPMR